MADTLIYADQGHYYDLIYKWKDYKKEVAIIESLIAKFKGSEGKKLLDVGCGTGEHIKYLKDYYDCVGMDINSSLLKIAAKKLKGTKFIKGSMIDFKIDEKFDVITCLFSSIGYVKTLGNLEKTLGNFFLHLKRGGVVIIEPWFNKHSKSFKVNVPFLTTYEEENTKIARLSIAKIIDNLSIMDTHYIVAESGRGIKHFSDVHKLGLFDKSDFITLMKKVGFTSFFLEKGLMEEDRGLYVGVKE